MDLNYWLPVVWFGVIGFGGPPAVILGLVPRVQGLSLIHI